VNLPVKPKAKDSSLLPHIDGVLPKARELENSQGAIQESHRQCVTHEVDATREARHGDQERHRRTSGPPTIPG
jgi:hypothetical protein